MKKKLLSLVIILIISFTITGCSGTNVDNNPSDQNFDNSTIPANVTKTGSVYNISIKNSSFPAELKIKKGERVIWTNAENMQHTVTFASISKDSGVLNKGGTFDLTFENIGTFSYVCNFHPGMTGKIIVE